MRAAATALLACILMLPLSPVAGGGCALDANCGLCDAEGRCVACWNDKWHLWDGDCVYCDKGAGMNYFRGKCYTPCPAHHDFVWGYCIPESICPNSAYLRIVVQGGDIKASCGVCHRSCLECVGPTMDDCTLCEDSFPSCVPVAVTPSFTAYPSGSTTPTGSPTPTSTPSGSTSPGIVPSIMAPSPSSTATATWTASPSGDPPSASPSAMGMMGDGEAAASEGDKSLYITAGVSFAVFVMGVGCGIGVCMARARRSRVADEAPAPVEYVPRVDKAHRPDVYVSQRLPTVVEVDPAVVDEILSAAMEEKPRAPAAAAPAECAICCDAPPVFAIYPCGHRCICDGYLCLDAFVKQQPGKKLCPLCRGKVQDVLRVYD